MDLKVQGYTMETLLVDKDKVAIYTDENINILSTNNAFILIY
jgi:hypothetical protein